MKIFEYQAMTLFTRYGIPNVLHAAAHTPEEAQRAAEKIGGTAVVVKAQVLTGGRGKAGGIKIARSPQEANTFARTILGMNIKSIPVKKVLVSQAVDIKKEYYLGLTVDRGLKKIVFIGSPAGGVDIEELAKNEPDKIYTFAFDPLVSIHDDQLHAFAADVFAEPELVKQALEIMKEMHRLFVEKDCSLIEINPLVKTADSLLRAVDAKITFDDNAVFKHPDIDALRNAEEYSAEEISARKANLSYVNMDGTIGCIVNGAGLAMATMDVIKLSGGEPANFLDVGGSSNPAKVLNALKIILSNKKVNAILINIFGGITRCDDIAQGIIMAKRQIDIPVPMVIRLIGTNEKEALKILKDNGLDAAETMSEAIEKVVKLSKN